MDEKDLHKRSKKNLLETAANLKIRGRSGMTKEKLIKAITRILQPRKADFDRKDSAPKRRKVRRKPAEPLRETVVVRRSWREQQALVQHAKYQAKIGKPREAPQVTAKEEEIPCSYADDRIVLLVRDPYWVHVYWDISRQTLIRAKAALRDQWYDAKSILRIYDVTGVDFDGKNANSSFDIGITGGATNWYVNTAVPNRTYCVDIGLLSDSGDFILLARSNKATTPRDAPSDVVDEKWMIPDWEFEKVYALSGGFSVGASSLELKELMEKALGGEISSGAPGSFAISSPLGREARARGFWFRLDTELIVYGATEPDARVTLQGRPLKLRPDGTFSVRFALPDGTQTIPAVAESRDGVEKRTITPIVTRKTEE
jgi:hypothetical protein